MLNRWCLKKIKINNHLEEIEFFSIPIICWRVLKRSIKRTFSTFKQNKNNMCFSFFLVMIQEKKKERRFHRFRITVFAFCFPFIRSTSQQLNRFGLVCVETRKTREKIVLYNKIRLLRFETFFFLWCWCCSCCRSSFVLRWTSKQKKTCRYDFFFFS